MDPATLLLAALSAGATAAAKDTANEAVKDAYHALRALVQRRFAGKPEAQLALAQHEAKPSVWEAPLKDALESTGADQNVDIIRAAQRLMALLQPPAAIAQHGNGSIATSGGAIASRGGINVLGNARVGTIGGQGGVTVGGHGSFRGDVHFTTMSLSALDSIDEATKRRFILEYEREIQDSPDSVKYYLAIGLCYIDLRYYSEATGWLRDGLKRNPRDAALLYHLALARIGGRRPRIMPASDIAAVDTYLGSAIRADDHPSRALYLSAFVKADYYVAQCLREPPPTVEDLIAQIARNRCAFDEEAQKMREHARIPAEIVDYVTRRSRQLM